MSDVAANGPILVLVLPWFLGFGLVGLWLGRRWRGVAGVALLAIAAMGAELHREVGTIRAAAVGSVNEAEVVRDIGVSYLAVAVGGALALGGLFGPRRRRAEMVPPLSNDR